MANFSIILDTRKANAQGLFPIKFLLTHNNTNTSISTGLFVGKEMFTGNPLDALNNKCPNHEQINSYIRILYINYMESIYKAEEKYNISNATAAEVRELLKKNAAQKEEIVTFSKVIREYMSNCNSAKTASGYKYAFSFLCEFFGRNEITFEELNYENIVKFNRWLERDHALSVNTRSIIFRNIRTIFNHAIKTDKINSNLYPFKKFEIKSAQKEKRFLTIDELISIINADVKGGEKMARDFFLLSFYLCGINPIDLFNLRKPNKRGEVSFIRQKIAHTEPQPVHLFVEQIAQDIADQYPNDIYFVGLKKKHREYETFKRRASERLASVGDKLGITNLNFYLARYTWATIADKIGIPHEIISKALGHTDSTTAEKYYISFDWNKVREANKKVIDYVLDHTSSSCKHS
jgi:integrase